MTKYPSFVDRCMNFEQSENLLCFICRIFTTNNNKIERWKTHFADPLHRLVLEKFNESFYQSSQRHISCKICLKLIVKADFIEHAIEHELVPWYKSPDMFKIFSINFIAEIDGQYHCHLCKEQFSFWYSALLHVDNQKHQQNHRNKIDYDIVNETNTYTVNHQLLISHSIFRKNLQMFECMICKQCVCGHQNIDEHIKGRSHQKNQTRFINEFLGMQEKNVNNDTSSKNQTLSTNNLETNKENTSSNILSHASKVEHDVGNEKNLPSDLNTTTFINELLEKQKKIIYNENSSENQALSTNNLETNEENTSSNVFPNASKVNLKLKNKKNLPPKYPKHKCVTEFPEEIRGLLTMSERICNGLLAEIDCNIDDEKYKEKCLMEYLEKIARENFPNPIIYSFGSRVSGLGSKNSDLDVCIDCNEVYCQDDSSGSITQALKTIEESLRNYPEIWKIDRIIHEKVRVPIIKAYHKPTGIDCDISFSNRLGVENTKLIKSYINAYPLCRKLIIFMRTWIKKCNLYGYKTLSSYAIAWMVIFFLQCKNILPSVNKLIALKKKSRVISGWQVGVIEQFEVLTSNQNFMQLLKELFIFYSQFNYKYEVMCPLLGKTVEKEKFISLELPTAMNPYIIHLQQKESKKLRVFSTMCLQDPFDLSHNLTKSVSKFTIDQLKIFYRRSAQILENNF